MIRRLFTRRDVLKPLAVASVAVPTALADRAFACGRVRKGDARPNSELGQAVPADVAQVSTPAPTTYEVGELDAAALALVLAQRQNGLDDFERRAYEIDNPAIRADLDVVLARRAAEVKRREENLLLLMRREGVSVVRYKEWSFTS